MSLQVSITEIQKVLIYRGDKPGIAEGVKKKSVLEDAGTNMYQRLLQFVILHFKDNLEKLILK